MTSKNILALDVGDTRVGAAFVHADVSVPICIPTLQRKDKDFWANLQNIVREHDIAQIVIGLPRDMTGNHTNQTKKTEEFATELTKHINLPIAWQDEALTSVRAESELGYKRQNVTKSDVDALAASFILSDYLETEVSLL